jgi:hypothetical protein
VLRHGIDVVVDAARDVLGSLGSRQPRLAQATIEKWIGSASPLLRRLAVNGLREAEWLSANEKLMWLLEKNLLYEPATKHEVFQLISEVLIEADPPIRHSVLRRAKRGVSAKEAPRLRKRTRDYEKYNLLLWMSRAAPKDSTVVTAFKHEQERHPDFGPRDDPDLVIGEVRTSSRRSSFTVERLLAMHVGEARVAKLLLEFRDEADEFDTERFAFREVLSAATAQEPSWGLRLGRTLKRLGAWQSDVWPALATGWGASSLEGDEWKRIFSLLKSHGDPAAYADDFARLLVTFIQSQPQPSSPAVVSAESFSDKLWRSLEDSSSELTGPDWLSAAVNSPGGKLVEFWIRVLSLRSGETELARLPRADRSRFNLVVSTAGPAAEAGRILLASQLHLLLSIDRTWTIQTVLPLFVWESNERRAEEVWNGFLAWARLNEVVIEVMLPMYTSSLPRLRDRDEEWRRRFANHLALIAVRSSRNVLDDGWLVPLVTQAGIDARVEWASHVAFLLRELEDSGKELQWEKWISAYWIQRLNGVPRALAKSEVGEMAAWVVALEPVFEAAVELLVRSPSARPKRYVYDLLDDGGLPTAQPIAVLHMLRHVLTDERQPFYACTDVVSVLEKAATQSPSASELGPVVDQLVGLGCDSALAVLSPMPMPDSTD